MKLVIAAMAAVLGLAACDSGGGGETAAPAAAPAAPRPAPTPPPEPPKPAGMPGLTEAFATEADWVAACTAVPLDATVCGCVGKATTSTLGAPAYYTWVWEAYVQRNAIAQNRSKRWLDENGIDEAGAKKFTDAVGKCYVTQ